ncbi:MAG: class I SAM-dependent methyltransferase [Armatimonadia bacterium]
MDDRRREILLARRQKDWDAYAHNEGAVMYRRSDGTPEPPTAEQAVVAQLLELLAPEPQDSLLDAGCGAGELTRHLRPHFGQVVATDLSAAMLERARQLLPGVPLHATPAHQLPFPDGSFSRALSYSVFFYFPDYPYVKQVFEEMLRV